VPLGSNAVEKNKAATAFDNVLWEIASCYTNDVDRTVCSHWVQSTWKFMHFTHKRKKEWNSFEAIGIEPVWKSTPVCVIQMYAIWLFYSNAVTSVWPSPGGLKLLCFIWLKKRGKSVMGLCPTKQYSHFSGLGSAV